MSDYTKLTPEEENIILHKGTEEPFTGEFNDFFEDGIYKCKQCAAPLYRSNSKFDGGCGWPSFDDEMPGAVKRLPDADGRRTEIVCANCNGHLGHVFLGEQHTLKNVRHCVNSASIAFTEDKSLATAVVAGGCFWGVQALFNKTEGVLSSHVGYTGGDGTNPTYEEVCTGETGHLEAIQIKFDSAKISYRDVIKSFFNIHDPTQTDGQGPDKGSQYHSAIFYTSPEQQSIAEDVIKELEQKGHAIATVLKPLEQFWVAEEYHQDYYKKTGKAPYCHIYKDKFK